jgi:hypothetical protein
MQLVHVPTAKPPHGIAGGCQCGAVRYRSEMTPQNVHYCHCRMCQKAVGNVFAALVPVKKQKLLWPQAPPTFFRSSSVADRGFCGVCGTPLSFAYLASEWIAVTLGSLDEPALVVPTVHYGVESQLPWFHIDDGLPREPTEDEKGFLAGMVSHQRSGGSKTMGG